MLLPIAAFLSRELYIFCYSKVRNGIQHYANARKRVHMGFTFLIFIVEAVAIFSIHEPVIHLLMSGGVTSWEAMVIRIGEEAEDLL